MDRWFRVHGEWIVLIATIARKATPVRKLGEEEGGHGHGVAFVSGEVEEGGMEF